MATDKQKVTQAFRNVRRAGGHGWQALSCCIACSFGEAEDRLWSRGMEPHKVVQQTFVFTTKQAVDAFQMGFIRGGLAVNWRGDIKLITQAFIDAGLVFLTPVNDQYAFMVFNNEDSRDEWVARNEWYGYLSVSA